MVLHPVDVTLEVASGVTDQSPPQYARGASKYALHVNVSATGGSPSAVVAVEGCNIDPTSNTTWKEMGATAALVATGDTYLEIDSYPYKWVRIRVTSNTDVTLKAVLHGES